MDKFNYIDQIVKSKLDNYSVPVKHKLNFNNKNELKFTKKISKKLFFYTFLIVVLFSVGSFFKFRVKPDSALTVQNFEFKIDSNRQVYIPNENNLEVNKTEQTNVKENGKKIVVIEIDQTEIDTVKK